LLTPTALSPSSSISTLHNTSTTQTHQLTSPLPPINLQRPLLPSSLLFLFSSSPWPATSKAEATEGHVCIHGGSCWCFYCCWSLAAMLPEACNRSRESRWVEESPTISLATCRGAVFRLRGHRGSTTPLEPRTKRLHDRREKCRVRRKRSRGA
jgi:hypothetical protein